MTDAGSFPARQQWAIARDGHPAELSSIATPLLRKGEPIAFVGGRLAAELMAPLRAAGFKLFQSDRRHPALADIPAEDPEYETFGHGYGEVHTAREFRQLVERAARVFVPEEDRWREDDRIVDPFRPGLRYPARSDQEFDVLQERHLNAVRTTFRRARTLVVALSQSEVWESRADGAVFPRWTTAAERHFDPERHSVRALTVEETVLDLAAAVATLRALNPGLAIVLMVSPEPQLATAHPGHVLVAGSLGKAVLRLAMESVAGTEGVSYFPALEIAAREAPAGAYGEDGALPSAVATTIADALLAISEDGVVTFAGDAAPVAVLRTVPVDDSPARQPVAATATGTTSATTRKSAVSVVDAYSDPKVAEDIARAEKRAANRARGLTGASDAADKPSLTVAERQQMRQEKLAARETARLAAEQARAAADTAGGPDQGKGGKKARKAVGADAGSDAAAGAAPRRERQREPKR